MNLGYQGSLDEPFQPQPVEVSEKKLGKRSFFNRRLSDQPRLIKDIIPKQVDRPTDNYGNIPWAEPVETNYYSTRNEPVDYPSSYYRTRNESVDHPANYYRTQNEFTKSDWQSTTVHNHPYTRYQKSQEIKPWDEGKTSDEILPKSENFSLDIQDIDPVFIIYGSRPGPPPATPPCYIELMKLCWDSNPKKRPTAGQLVRILDDWIHSKRKQLDIIYNSFQNAELELNYINYSKEPVDEKDYTHIDETYTSKLISIKDIVNRINQEKLQQKK
ncbi:18386_t:CDS:2 [Rhizophagus irregularis]|nr:18386_t:CDS:2 [Rhizophagus irregularis]